MEKHKCKLCFKAFTNGRALGGHMKAHLTTVCQPPPIRRLRRHLLGCDSASLLPCSFSSSEEQKRSIKSRAEEEIREMGFSGLRENPNKWFRLADPGFSFAGDGRSSAVADGESDTETESRKNPTRRRSKRIKKSGSGENPEESFDVKFKNQCWVAEQSPETVSSVSDTCSDEDVAVCLMMLSRDVWTRKNQEQEKDFHEEHKERSVQIIKETEEIKVHEKCEKSDCHRRICSENMIEKTSRNGRVSKAEVVNNGRNFECPYCFRVFGSGQALGGHKRSHLIMISSSNMASAGGGGCFAENSAKFQNNFIDLNLPAPMEDDGDGDDDDDEFSVVSNA